MTENTTPEQPPKFQLTSELVFTIFNAAGNRLIHLSQAQDIDAFFAMSADMRRELLTMATVQAELKRDQVYAAAAAQRDAIDAILRDLTAAVENVTLLVAPSALLPEIDDLEGAEVVGTITPPVEGNVNDGRAG